jgi:uncharacterized protein YgiM (DUF1202 family)
MYVKADILNVRRIHAIKSQILGNLYFGQLVCVMEKKKDWTKIRWEDEKAEISIEGWVFSRYLKKFN